MAEAFPRSCDVLIAGGGVVGSAIAYFLAAEPAFDGSVVVVEPDPSYEGAATPRSLGGVRQQFTTPENVAISRFAVEFVRAAPERLTVDGDTPDLGFREAGYLFLADEPARAGLEAAHEIHRANRAPTALLDPEELARRFPWLETGDLALGSLGLADEGWIDPHALLHAFRRKARSLGVIYVRDALAGIERAGARVVAATLAGGTRIGCVALVDAAGARAAEVAAMAGADVPVRPRRRQVFVFECRAAVEGCPLVVDPTGLYFRPEGPGFLCGRSPAPEDDPDTLDREVDWGRFEDELWPLLAARVPAFEAVKCVNAWGCTYAFNTIDQNAIVGPHPDIRNLLLANGFSGHGLQQSPAVGRAIAELIAFGGYRTLDLSRLGLDRFAAGHPIREGAVV